MLQDAGGPDPLLSLRDWSLARRVPGGERTILDRIDLDIRPGSWLAVLGANGSGKSSLLKYLAADESPLADRRPSCSRIPTNRSSPPAWPGN